MSRPTIRSASFSRRPAIPVVPSSVPSSTKKGMASREVFCVGEMMRCTAMGSGTVEKKTK